MDVFLTKLWIKEIYMVRKYGYVRTPEQEMDGQKAFEQLQNKRKK